MNILFWALVTYVAADLVACGYVVFRRGGIRQTVADIRANLGYIRRNEDF